MAKVYKFNCRDGGFDCDQEVEADTIQGLVEGCSYHCKGKHGLRSFGIVLYINLRLKARLVDTDKIGESPG